MEVVAQARRPAGNRDMFLSLLVLLVPLAVIVAIYTHGPTDAKVQTVNWRPVAAQARQQASYAVLAPVELPAGWRATRVSWTRTGQPDPTGQESVRDQWQLGVLTDSDVYIELDQGDRLPNDMVAAVSRQGAPDGTSTVDGQRWKRLVTDDNRTRSLVLTAPHVTSIVSGDVDYSLLETYVGLLQSQTKS